jgi:hypothetical protein
VNNADDQLRDLFAQDEPPPRDPAFSMAVMARIARRRFLSEVGILSLVSVIGGTVLWSAWPALAANLGPLIGGLSPVIACAILAIAAVILMERHVTGEPN